MKFQKDKLVEYRSNTLSFIQKFKEYSYELQRLSRPDFDIISINKDYKSELAQKIPGHRFKL
jgi:hypothetical protein